MNGNLLVLLYSLVLSGAEGIENFPKRMNLWLVRHGFVTDAGEPDGAAFRGRLYNIVGTFAVFGLMVMLYSMVLGSSTADPAAFNTKFKYGLGIFGLAWVVLLVYLFLNFSRLLFVGLLGLSALFLYITVDNLSGLIQTVMPIGGVVNSMAGSFPVGKYVVFELEMVTRAWVLFGFMVTMIGVLPVVLATTAIQALFALLSAPVGTVTDLLRRTVSDDQGEAEAARKELSRLTEKELSAFNLFVLGICLLGVALSAAPSMIGLMFAVAIGMVSAVTLMSKKGFDVVGHDLSKWVHGATIVLVLGGVALYISFLGFGVYRMGPNVYIPFGILFVALFVMLLVVVKNTSLRAERDEYAKGDVDYEPYKLRTTAVGVTEVVNKEKTVRDWSWLSSQKLWVPVAVVAAVVVWFFLGQPNPLSGGLGYMNSSTLLTMLFVGGAAIWLCRD